VTLENGDTLDIHFTPEAIREVKRLRQYQQVAADAVLHIGIEPGCCAEFSCTMSFIPDSESFKQGSAICGQCNDLGVMVYTSDLATLSGLTVDYSEDLMGGAFRYLQPKAAYTCDCGTSFTIDGDKTEVFSPAKAKPC